MKLFKNKHASSDQPRRRHYTPSPSVNTFQKNRTLTGSTSRDIASTNENDAQLKSPRAHAHHLSTLRRRLLLYFGAVILVCAVLYVIASQLIAQVVIDKNQRISSARSSAYASRIEAYLSGRPAERLGFVLDRGQLLSYVQQKYPEVRMLSITSASKFGDADVSVSLRKPIARWQINGQNNFVDASGVVFRYNGYSTPELEIVDRSGIPSKSTGAVASNRFLTFVGQVVGDMGERGFTVTRATIPRNSIRELDIRVKRASYYLKLSTDRSAGEQAEDSKRVIEYLDKKGRTPKYVDVRIEGEAFYK